MTDGELTKDNMSVAIVGKGTPLTLLEDADLEPHLAALADEAGGGAPVADCLSCIKITGGIMHVDEHGVAERA